MDGRCYFTQVTLVGGFLAKYCRYHVSLGQTWPYGIKEIQSRFDSHFATSPLPATAGGLSRLCSAGLEMTRYYHRFSFQTCSLNTTGDFLRNIGDGKPAASGSHRL